MPSISSCKNIAALAAAALVVIALPASSFAHAPQSSPRRAAKSAKAAPSTRFIVLLDPGHGGVDSGTPLPSNTTEKSAALAFALHLRDALVARGLEVRMTRDSDAYLSPDQRGEISASLQPSACLNLHLTGTGSGVHVFTALPAPPEANGFTPYSQVQAQYLHQSRLFASTIEANLKNSAVPVSLSPASLPALERMHCPAVAIELSPATAAAAASINSLTQGILTWRAQWTRMMATQ